MRKLLLFLLFPLLTYSQTQIGQDIDGLNNFDVFGKSVSLSSDGSIVAVASYESNSTFSDGRVRVFQNTNNSWSQIGQDIQGDFYNATFDDNVSLSSSGTILAIGSPRTNFSEGLVRVFELINGVWTQVGQDLTGDLNEESEFGNSIALSSDGNIIVVSAPKYDDNILGVEIGRVRVFELINNTRNQVGQDIPGTEQFDNLGYKLSISDNGNIIGLTTTQSNGSNSGFASIYENVNNVWTQIGSNLVGDGMNDGFGRSISLSSDGSIVAVGAPNNTTGGTNKGYARVYQNNSGNWIQIGQDILGVNDGDFTGSDVALSSNGDIIAVGEIFHTPTIFEAEKGSVRMFKNNSNNWIQVGNRIVGEANFDRSGSSVALSSDGGTIAIGAILNDAVGGNGNGHVRVYDIEEEIALLEVVEDIAGNTNGINVTASQLNSITGVSGAIDGVNYTTALDNGTFADEDNPTAIEIQAIIDQVNSTLSLDDVSKIDFSLYPNPAKTSFIIELGSTNQLKSVTIYNKIGQLVQTSRALEVDTTKLQSGMYIVEIQTDKGKASKKLIIE